MSAVIDDLKRRMHAAIEILKKEFGGLRTGRASASLLDNVMVSAYGSPMPINQVSTISVPEARLITIQVWDKGMIREVEKAILESGLGLNPQVDGTLIRLPLPDLNPLPADRQPRILGVEEKTGLISSLVLAPARCRAK